MATMLSRHHGLLLLTCSSHDFRKGRTLTNPRRYKTLALVANWYWLCGALIGVFGVGIGIVILVLGIGANNGNALISGLITGGSTIVGSIVAAISLIATSQGIELAMDIEKHLRESRDLQQRQLDLLNRES